VFVSVRRCGKCGEVKPESAFNRAGDGRQHWCRECFKAYFKARGAVHLAQVKESRERRQAPGKKLVRDYLRTHPCTDCGEPDLRVLDFDHVDEFRKEDEISAMWRECFPLDYIESEIRVCEVVCANCHRRRTAERGRWQRLIERPTGVAGRPRKDRNVRWVYDYLRDHPCVDCGEADPLLLEFDHVGDKRGGVMDLAWGEYSIESIEAEIAKCEVRCCNCHRRKTAERRSVRAALELRSRDLPL
jgi:hypothetical protein